MSDHNPATEDINHVKDLHHAILRSSSRLGITCPTFTDIARYALVLTNHAIEFPLVSSHSFEKEPHKAELG